MTYDELSGLETEQANTRTEALDVMGAADIIGLINDEDFRAVEAVRAAIPAIACAVDLAAQRWARGGRVALFGSGTSGRLAALDAAELPPTFGIEASRYEARLAGGPTALQRSVEGSEDDVDAGVRAASDLGPRDVAVGLAASGRTPYTVGALRTARLMGAATIAVACVERSALAKEASVAIEIVTGPEVLSGSTRMKAGTAEKMALTAFSTALMVRVGGVYGNLMVGMRVSNEKLRQRAVRMVAELSGVSSGEAQAALEESGNSVAVAVMMLKLGTGRERAERIFSDSGGNLRRALHVGA